MGDADAVTVKIPPFWTHSPTAWFAQAEAQFVLRKITEDDTKYYYIVAALDSATATRAVSILSQPPITGNMRTLRSSSPLPMNYQTMKELRHCSTSVVLVT